MTDPHVHAASKDGDDSIAILNPDREITINGETLTVREYGFFEGMRLAAHVQPIVDSLADAIGIKPEVTLIAIRVALADHADDVAALIAASCGKTVEWVEGLTDADGDRLLLTWYAVNSDFFVRRVMTALQVKRAMASALIGQMSSRPSSITDTTPNASASTRNAS